MRLLMSNLHRSMWVRTEMSNVDDKKKVDAPGNVQFARSSPKYGSGVPGSDSGVSSADDIV